MSAPFSCQLTPLKNLLRISILADFVGSWSDE